MTGWGVSPSEFYAARPNSTYPGHQYDHRAADMYWLLLLAVCLPAAALLVISVRVGAERRDRRVAMLAALGAPPRARAAVLAGEAALPVLAGTSVAGLVALLTTVTGLALPVTGHVAQADDLATARATLAIWWLAVTVLLVGAAVLGQLRSRRAAGNRPAAVVHRVGPWAPVALGFFIAVALAGTVSGADPGSSLFGLTVPVLVYLVGVAGALATLPFVAGRAAGAVGTRIARAGAAAGWPAAIVGGRWLAARPHALARLSAALVIGLCLATLAQILFVVWGSALSEERRATRAVGDAVVEVTGAWDETELRRFASAVGPDRVVYGMDTDEGIELLAPCSNLRQLGELTGCPSNAVPIEDAYPTRTAVGEVVRSSLTHLSGSSMSVTAAGAAPPADRVAALVVLNNAGVSGVEEIKRSAYATISMPVVLLPNEPGLLSIAGYTGVTDWLVEFGLWGLVILFLSGVLAAMGTFLAVARELGSLAGQGAGRGLYLATAMWNIAVPLVLAVAISTAVSVALGRMLVELAGAGGVDAGFLAGVALAGAGIAVAVGVLCGAGAARRAWSWRPTGD